MTIGISVTKATPNRLVIQVTGDSSASSYILTNAVLQAACVSGPLLSSLNRTYSNQAAMRAEFGGGNTELRMNSRSIGGLFAADVDTDAVATSKPEINLVIPVSAAVAYLVVEHKHSAIR